jgi:hypothetical protein
VNAAPRGAAWALRFGASFLLLNALLTFENLPGSAALRFGQRLSFELCVGVGALLAWVAWRGPLGRRGASAAAGLCLALALLRYADGTVRELFGRPINLVWDARHARELLAMAASDVGGARTAAFCAMALLAAALLFLLARRAVQALADALRWTPAHPWLAAAMAVLGLSFAAHPFTTLDTRWFFSLPVSPTLARQSALLWAATSAERTEAQLTPSPSFAGTLDGLHGADVLLVFAESYGMGSFDRPRQAGALAAARARLLQALHAGGREVVSARVRSPTFGGASWLAHAALLTGVDTQDPDDHALLLTTQRPTLARHFARHGWRSVAWMPGLQRPWPEGAFYGFERIADAHGIGYTGPAFGYWRIPDQAAMALLAAQELAGEPPAGGGARQPRFIVFPTLSTHAPFRPLAPYQPDWPRLLGPEAYTPAQLAAALHAPTALAEPVPAYLASIAYTYEWLGAWWRERAPASLVTVVIGDHQPVASISGANASWDVPVHVVTRDAALLQRLQAAGFVPGLWPGAAPIGAMHELTGALLAAFDVPRPVQPAKRPGPSVAAVTPKSAMR